MSVPLATLRRHGLLVWLHDPLGLPTPAVQRDKPPVRGAIRLDVRQGSRVAFTRPADAENWLLYWKSDSGAMQALRSAAQRSETSAPVYLWNDDQLLRHLAARLARDAVVAIQSAEVTLPAMLPAAPPPPTFVDPPAIPVAQLLAPKKPELPPLLPLLEEVQIEGADVLPEIEQTLEQVDLTLEEIKLQPVSLAPTPSKVPQIREAMTQAGADVTSTLDGL